MPARTPDLPEAEASPLREAFRSWQAAVKVERDWRETFRRELGEETSRYGPSAVARAIGWDRRRLHEFLGGAVTVRNRGDA